MNIPQRVAIVGIGGIFPQRPTLEQFWANIRAGVDTAREVPPGRWVLSAADSFDPQVGAPDRVYSRRGCFVDELRLETEGLDLDPSVLAALDPMFHLVLHAGRQAWRDGVTEPLDRQRVGVIIGNLVMPTDKSSELVHRFLGRTFEEKVTRPGAAQALNRFEALNRYVTGLPGGVLAKALGLGGGSFTLDAACASSLYALKLAVDELLAGRADAMLAGGLSPARRPLHPDGLRAAARRCRRRGRCSRSMRRPTAWWSARVPACSCLKRLEDALRNGDRIYAVIAGIGLSNDVHGRLLAPSFEGQLRAMRAAYRQAGWGPRDVDLIECHATGTPVGDSVEFESLRTLWDADASGPIRQCIIGSVKSNIGHALTAAGAAGLLKVLLALKEKVLPPTANFTAPGPNLGLQRQSLPGAGREPALGAPVAGPAAPRGRQRRSASAASTPMSCWKSGMPVRGVPNRPLSPGRLETGPTRVAIVGLAPALVRGIRCVLFRSASWAAENPRNRRRRNTGGERPTATGSATEAATAARFTASTWTSWRCRADRFRIPPRELEELLPQQVLMLQVAAEAIADASWREDRLLQTGVFIGLGLDFNVTNFHLRWSLLDKARAWARELGLDLSPQEVEDWAPALRDASGPASNPNRTMGALGGIVASRVAREFHVGGPSFTISSEESSGLRALAGGGASAPARRARSGDRRGGRSGGRRSRRAGDPCRQPFSRAGSAGRWTPTRTAPSSARGRRR